MPCILSCYLCTHACTTHTLTRTHTQTHSHPNTLAHTHTHILTLSHIHTHSFSHIHIHTHTYIHSHLRIHTHTHTIQLWIVGATFQFLYISFWFGFKRATQGSKGYSHFSIEIPKAQRGRGYLAAWIESPEPHLPQRLLLLRVEQISA